MRFSIAIIALLGAVPHFTNAFAVPAEDVTSVNLVADAPVVPFTQTIDLLSKRADDEWLMVIYNNGSPGNQCGGVANDFDGRGSICWGLNGVTGKLCADLKLQANTPFGQCEFKFNAAGDKCGGSTRQDVTVKKGHDNNGVKLSDDVRFVSVNCS